MTDWANESCLVTFYSIFLPITAIGNCPRVILIAEKAFHTVWIIPEMWAIGDNTAWSDRISYQLITELVVAKLTSHDVIMMISAGPFPYEQDLEDRGLKCVIFGCLCNLCMP